MLVEGDHEVVEAQVAVVAEDVDVHGQVVEEGAMEGPDLAVLEDQGGAAGEDHAGVVVLDVVEGGDGFGELVIGRPQDGPDAVPTTVA